MAMKGRTLTGVAAIIFSGGVILLTQQSDGRVAYTPTSAAAGRQEIEAFNQKFIEAHLKMDNAAIIGMWAEDGVSLLPEMAPMVGKKTIAAFLEKVVSQMPGYHMQKVELDFQGIEVDGEWASEWAMEHQIADAPAGKQNFEGYGKMLLVLHKEVDGNWRVKREMWNQGIKPEIK